MKTAFLISTVIQLLLLVFTFLLVAFGNDLLGLFIPQNLLDTWDYTAESIVFSIVSSFAFLLSTIVSVFTPKKFGNLRYLLLFGSLGLFIWSLFIFNSPGHISPDEVIIGWVIGCPFLMVVSVLVFLKWDKNVQWKDGRLDILDDEI